MRFSCKKVFGDNELKSILKFDLNLTQLILGFCLSALLVVFSSPVSAKQMAGIKIKEVIRLSPKSDPLLLNGASTKKKSAHTIYIGGLYLQSKQHNLDEILADNGPKRILLYCKTNAISAKTFINSFAQGLTINNPPEIISALTLEIESFQSVWKTNAIKQGDEIWIDFIPGVGTKVSINGDVKQTIKGDLFYQAFLRAWLGKYPVNQKLKEAMLDVASN